MKPLHNIDTRETGLGSAGAIACLSLRLPASECGAPFCFDAGLATPPERVRRPGANDNILLETGEMQ